jgi:hypothetical protein
MDSILLERNYIMSPVGNLTLPTNLPLPAIDNSNPPEAVRTNNEKVSNAEIEFKQLFPNAPIFDAQDVIGGASRYIGKSLNGASIPKSHAVQIADTVIVIGKPNETEKYTTYKLIKDITLGDIRIPKNSTIINDHFTGYQDFEPNFTVTTPNRTVINFSASQHPRTGEHGYEVHVKTKDGKTASANAVGAFAVTKDGKIQSIQAKGGYERSFNPRGDYFKVNNFTWRAREPQLLLNEEDKAAWQAVSKLIQSQQPL